MATLTAKVDAKFSINLAGTTEITGDALTSALNATVALANLTDGTGANKANTYYRDQRTLAGGASENIDVYDFGGSAADPLGATIANACVKALYIRNNATDVTHILTVGGIAATTAWNSILNSDDDAAITVPAGGALLLIAPLAAGFAVADSTNHLLKVARAGSGSATYDIIVIGATAAS